MTVAAAPPAVGASLSPVSVVLILARFEGRKMLNHPVVWLGAVASAALAVFELIEEAPVLNRASMTLAWTMAPLAVAVALVAGWAVLRARGRTDAHPTMVMPVTMEQRVGGILLGLNWPALATLVVQLILLAWILTRDPVTSIVWTELLVGPIYVIFAGALAVALTRWVPHPSTPLFGVVALGGMMIAFPYRSEDWGSIIGIEWLSPLVWPQGTIPYELAFRPAGLHLAYLIGLTLLVGGCAVLGRWRVVWMLVAAGLILAATTGPAQLGPVAETKRLEVLSRLVGDSVSLTCETHYGIDFCALPGYQGWIELWAGATKPIVEAAPSEILEHVEVRQYPVHFPFVLDRAENVGQWWWEQPASEDLSRRPSVLSVGTMWGNHSYLFVASDLAGFAMGCAPICEGESQMVVRLWMLSHHPQVRSDTEEAMSRRSDGASVAECMVAEIWSLPDERNLIHANWEALTSLATTYEDAGAILGITVPKGEDEYGYLDQGCP